MMTDNKKDLGEADGSDAYTYVVLCLLVLVYIKVEIQISWKGYNIYNI
jgi:hypothetical protein